MSIQNIDGYNKLIALGYSPNDAARTADANRPNPNFYQRFANDDPVGAGNANYSGTIRASTGQDYTFVNGLKTAIDGQAITSAPTTSNTVPPPTSNSMGNLNNLFQQFQALHQSMTGGNNSMPQSQTELPQQTQPQSISQIPQMSQSSQPGIAMSYLPQQRQAIQSKLGNPGTITNY